MRSLAPALLAVLGIACASAPPPPPPAPPAPKPLEPIVKGAAGDNDLRVMIAQIASAKACGMVEHQFRTLRAKTPADQPVIGAVWLRECKITHDGTKLTVDINGRGWEWVDRESKKAGASFRLKQYVKFDLHARFRGEVDVAYDPRTHVGTLWLSPIGKPEVEMKTVGDIDLDRDGVWSDVVGFVGSAVGKDPDRVGERQVDKEGTQSSITELARGLTITMNLCNGLSHMMLGRLPRGIYGPAGPGETRRAPIELQPTGVLVFPPQAAPDGLTIKVDSKGPVRIGLACRDQGEAAATAFLDGTPVAPKLLTEKVVTGQATLTVGPQRCPVTVIAQSVVPVPVSFDFERPLREAASATMDPMIRCEKATDDR
jgi:hypothetical protein